jgi:hypothetical protein
MVRHIDCGAADVLRLRGGDGTGDRGERGQEVSFKVERNA